MPPEQRLRNYQLVDGSVGGYIVHCQRKLDTIAHAEFLKNG